jgi:hypothetical protein
MTIVYSSSCIHKEGKIRERHTKLDPFIDFANPLELVRMSVVMRTIFLPYEHDCYKGPILSKESVNT